MADSQDEKAVRPPEDRVRQLSEERQRLLEELLKQGRVGTASAGRQRPPPREPRPTTSEAPSPGARSAGPEESGTGPRAPDKDGPGGASPAAAQEPPWNEAMRQWTAAFQAAAAAHQGAQPNGWGQAMPFPGAVPGVPPWATGMPFGGAPFGGAPFGGMAGTAESPPGGRQTSTDPLIALKKSGSLPPLFLAAPVFGSAFPYHYLALHLDPEQPVYGLQSPALDGRSEPHESIPDMARDYVAVMKRIQRHGPYYVGGYSFGGWTAFEIARQLLANGDPVAFLGILGTGLPPSLAAPLYAKAMEYGWELMDSQARLMRDTSLTEQQRLTQKQAEATLGTPLQRVAAANTRATMRYVPRPIESALSLFVTTDVQTSSPSDPTLGWWLLCTRAIDVHHHEGNHLNCFSEPHVQDLASKLQARLKSAREQAARPTRSGM